MDISAAKGQRCSRKQHCFPRLREENDLPADLDKCFSPWKILVGPKDWENHQLCREGARRYSLHNLPSVDGFHPGVYELALYYDENIRIRNKKRALQSNALVPVYVGHAVKVRDRLQAYGRNGSHLEGPLQNGACQHCEISLVIVAEAELGTTKKIVIPSEQKCCFSPHLFTRAFRFGYSIAYRWVDTKTKAGAEDFEAHLLRTYDYAWNMEGNGSRRAEDAFRKLKLVCESRVRYFLRKYWQKLNSSKVLSVHEERTAKIYLIKYLPRLLLCHPVPNNSEGIRHCESCKEMAQHVGLSVLKTVETGKPTLPRVTGVCTTGKDSKEQQGSLLQICGYVLEDGSKCMALPRKGLKRCEAHKGKHVKK